MEQLRWRSAQAKFPNRIFRGIFPFRPREKKQKEVSLELEEGFETSMKGRMYVIEFILIMANHILILLIG